jgi:histone deacetylase 6
LGNIAAVQMDPLPSPAILERDVDALMQNDSTIMDDVAQVTQNGFINPELLRPQEAQSSETTESQVETESFSETDTAAILRKGFLPTGCCYDDRMKCHANADFSASPAHPEDPRRIEAIMQEFKEGGLLYTGDENDLYEQLKLSPTKWMWRIAARKATKAEICTVHHPAHYDWVEQTGMMNSQDLRTMTTDFDNGRKSLYVGGLTYEAALISAGGAVETCKNVVAGNVKNAIAVIRPPGHHAEAGESMGFCIFNNVPIAARVCMTDYPETCRRVLILDWDVHHGNGIQNMFYNDPNVLYISIHVYQNGTFYPGQPDVAGIPDGGLDCSGAGPGLGKNINIGWHDQGMGDAEYMAAFTKVVMPIAQEFDPDLVIVSAGFDAAAGDELGGCWVTPACYSHMTHMLMSLADGKVCCPEAKPTLFFEWYSNIIKLFRWLYA